MVLGAEVELVRRLAWRYSPEFARHRAPGSKLEVDFAPVLVRGFAPVVNEPQCVQDLAPGVDLEIGFGLGLARGSAPVVIETW
jgi:hypothetical protein